MRPSKATTILSVLLCIIVIPPLLLLASQAATYPYVASKNSKVYHMIECGHSAKILELNRVYFANRSAAEASGRRPCSYCCDGIVSEGNSGNSNNSSGNHFSTTPPSTQPPATEPLPSQVSSVDASSWWENLSTDSIIFICSFVALLIAVGLYFLLVCLENKKPQQPPKLITALFFIFAAVAIPSAVLIFSIVFVCGGLMACVFVGIKTLIKYIKARISDKQS